MLIRAASRAAFNCAPMRVPSGTVSGVPFPLLALDTDPPMKLQNFSMKQRLTDRKLDVIITHEAGHI
jgi:hypothetical protein